MGDKQTATYLAECFWPCVTEAALEELDARVRQAAVATRAGPDEVRYEGTILVPDDEVVFCFFDGRSVEAVRAIADRAGVPFTRIIKSIKIASVKQRAATEEQA